MKCEVEILFGVILFVIWLPTTSLLQDSNTPLHLASEHGHLKIIKLLLSHAADINLRNKVGVTII